jgi:hypothetical protein
MYPRSNYEMTQADLDKIFEAIKPQAYIIVGGSGPRSQQERANDAWAELGSRMGFDHMTVQPIHGKGDRFFSAVPNENETQRAERMEREAAERKATEIARLNDEIAERQRRLAELL